MNDYLLISESIVLQVLPWAASLFLDFFREVLVLLSECVSVRLHEAAGEEHDVAEEDKEVDSDQRVYESGHPGVQRVGENEIQEHIDIKL